MLLTVLKLYSIDVKHERINTVRPTNTAGVEYAPRQVFTAEKGAECRTLAMGTIEIDMCAMLLRIHNGCMPGGGGVIPIISNCPSEEEETVGELPPMPIAPIPPTEVAEVPEEDGDLVMNYKHDKGSKPIVQLLVDGTVIPDVVIKHIDDNSFNITIPAGTPASEIIVAF